MFKIKKIFITTIITICSLNSYANEKTTIKETLNEFINKERLYTSDTYNYIYKNDNVFKFIDKVSKKGSSYKERESIISNNIPKLCYDLYYGESVFEPNRREGEICLQLNMLSGKGISAYYLSLISLNNKEKVNSIIYAGIAEGLGYKIHNTQHLDYLKSLPNYDDYFYLGIKTSIKLELIEKNSPAIEPIYFNLFKDKVSDPKYYAFESKDNAKIREEYDSLREGRFLDFINTKIKEEISGRNIVMLSSAKAGEWGEFVEYCSKRLQNKELGMYCLSQIYTHRKKEEAIFEYTAILYRDFIENKSMSNLKELMFLIGLQNQTKLVKTMLGDIILRNKTDYHEMAELVSFYNYGRLYSLQNK